MQFVGHGAALGHVDCQTPVGANSIRDPVRCLGSELNPRPAPPRRSCLHSRSVRTIRCTSTSRGLNPLPRKRWPMSDRAPCLVGSKLNSRPRPAVGANSNRDQTCLVGANSNRDQTLPLGRTHSAITPRSWERIQFATRPIRSNDHRARLGSRCVCRRDRFRAPTASVVDGMVEGAERFPAAASG